MLLTSGMLRTHYVLVIQRSRWCSASQTTAICDCLVPSACQILNRRQQRSVVRSQRWIQWKVSELNFNQAPLPFLFFFFCYLCYVISFSSHILLWCENHNRWAIWGDKMNFAIWKWLLRYQKKRRRQFELKINFNIDEFEIKKVV